MKGNLVRLGVLSFLFVVMRLGSWGAPSPRPFLARSQGETRVRDDVLRFNWNANDPKVKSTLDGLSADAVTELVYVIDRPGSVALTDIRGYKDSGATVESFRFLDLDGDGVLDLVCTLDFHSTGGVRAILVIMRRNQKFQYQQLEGSAPDGSLDDAIRDLDRDGHLEIVTQTLLTAYGGSETIRAFWPIVYAWDGQSYVRAENRFFDFYRTFSKEMKDKIEKFLQENPGVNALALDEATIAWQLPLSKARRLTGDDPRAGFADAVRLSSSANRKFRDAAIRSLTDIGDQESQSKILMMTEDSDFLIRSGALEALAKMGGRRFLGSYQRLLNDPYQTPTSARDKAYFPVRETARTILESLGYKVEGENGSYRVKN